MPICDGIRFDEISMFPSHLQTLLAARGVVWMTEFDGDGIDMGGSVIASDRDQAQAIADARGLGEKVRQVVGSLGEDPPYLP